MKILLKFLFFIFFIFYNYQFAYSAEKVAFLNIDIIFQKSNNGKLISKKLEDFKKKKLKNLKSKESEILKKESTILSQKNIISTEEFEIKVKEIRKEIALFNEDKKKISLEYEKKRNEELIVFMQTIRPIIEDYIKKNSISMVFNQKNLFIADKKYDITEAILKILNNNS